MPAFASAVRGDVSAVLRYLMPCVNIYAVNKRITYPFVIGLHAVTGKIQHLLRTNLLPNKLLLFVT